MRTDDKFTTVKTNRYETNKGVLYQISLEQPDGTTRNINFERNYFLGSERVLTASPLRLSAAEWKMFVDRGHGLHATSMVTRLIATLGLYIAQVERTYNLMPINKNGDYVLSASDEKKLAERDANAYQKYRIIQKTQAELRKLYLLERAVDPNQVTAQRDFKHKLIELLRTTRNGLYQQKQWSVDRMALTSDHMMAYAQEVVEKFEWPNNDMIFDARYAERYRITENDQLLAEEGGTVLYDSSKEPSSAAGGSVFSSTPGFGKAGRDNFAHCATLTDGFNRDQRDAFLARVARLKPSEGFNAEFTSQKDRACEIEAMRIASVVLGKGRMNLEIGPPPTFFGRESNIRDSKDATLGEQLLEIYNNPVGEKLCEQRFGSRQKLIDRVFYHIIVMCENDKDLDYALYNFPPSYSKIAENAQAERAKQDDVLKKAIKKLFKRGEIYLFGSKGLLAVKNSTERFELLVSVLAKYCIYGCHTFQDFKNKIDHALTLFSTAFCNQRLGKTKSELQEAVVAAALPDMSEDVFIKMKEHAENTGFFYDIVMQEAPKRPYPISSARLERSDRSSGSGRSMQTIPTPPETPREENGNTTEVTTPVNAYVAKRAVSFLPDLELQIKAREIAENYLLKSRPEDFELNKFLEIVKKRGGIANSRLTSESLYQFLIQASDAQFTAVTVDKKLLQTYLSPYHDLATIVEIRNALTEVHKAQQEYDAIYAEKLQGPLSSLSSRGTESPQIRLSAVRNSRSGLVARNNALRNSDKAKNHPEVLEKKRALDIALQKLEPHILKPDRESGDVLLRNSLIGYTYKLIDPIIGVLEKMGLHDPIRGSIALGIMGTTMGYVLVAHGATTAAAAAHSAFVATLNKTWIVPEVYRNMVVLMPGAKSFELAMATMVDGIALGKTTYLLTSLSDSIASGQLSGFSGNIINGIRNNPLETLLMTSLLIGFGHAMVIGLHEQHLMGPGFWEYLGGFFEAIKPGAVAFDTLLEMVKVVAHQNRLQGDETLSTNREKLAEMFARNLWSNLENADKKEFTVGLLTEKFLAALQVMDLNTDPIASIKAAFLTKFTDDQKKKLQSAFEKKASEKTKKDPAGELNKVIPENFAEFDEPSKIAMLLQLEYAIRLLASVNPDAAKQASKMAYPKPSDKVIQELREKKEKFLAMLFAFQKNPDFSEKVLKNLEPRFADDCVNSPLLFLKTLYEEQATAYSAGVENPNDSVHLNALQNYLRQLLIQDILVAKTEKKDLWKLISTDKDAQNILEWTAGVPFKFFQGFKLNATPSAAVDAIDKTVVGAFVNALSPKANLEGIGKMLNFIPRLVGNIASAVGTALSRVVTALTPESVGVLRGEEYMQTAGHEAARVFSGTTGKLGGKLNKVFMSQEEKQVARIAEQYFSVARENIALTHSIEKYKGQLREHPKQEYKAPSYRFDKTSLNMNALSDKQVVFPTTENAVYQLHVKLKKIVSDYEEKKSFVSSDSYLIQQLRLALHDFPKTNGIKEATLSVLSTIFWQEAAQLDQYLSSQNNLSDDKRGSMKLSALLDIYRREIIAAEKYSKTAHGVFDSVLNDAANTYDVKPEDDTSVVQGHLLSIAGFFAVRMQQPGGNVPRPGDENKNKKDEEQPLLVKKERDYGSSNH